MGQVKKLKLKKGDEVMVITGRDKGARGQISHVNPVAGRVVVAGVNVRKKAVRPNPQTGEEGGFIEKEASIHVSNVMLIDPVTNKPTRKRVV
ncbi:MAG: 50S ribosomal protein L24 [Holophagales bacterium]|jgi:large subunit ribosomal protein L24|nr:50S ribosomal protein L24 [Holophagales bacterium]